MSSRPIYQAAWTPYSLPAGVRKEKFPSQSGQTLFEMALLVPVILLLLVGVIEIGRYAYIGILVGNAARAGAEYAIQGNAQVYGPSIIAAAKNDFQNDGQNPNNLTVSPPSGITSFTFTGFGACTCDNGGAFNPSPASTNYCAAPPNGTNATAGTCPPGQHWVVMVGVKATGTFNSIIIPAGSTFLGFPGSIVINRTSILRVAP